MGKVSDALSKAGKDVQNDDKRLDGSDEQKKKWVSPPSESTLSKSAWDEKLVTATDVSNGVAESFRRLRALILHPISGKPIRSVLVTSAGIGEGKSFVCANLGAMMARGVDQHALMVDCDLRRPSLSLQFGIDNRNGLVDYLRDGVNLSSLICQTGLERLSLISAGIPPENPSELLSSKTMTSLIDEVVSRYPDRFVLLDSPPVLAASETGILAQHVDKVVLVVRWGSSGRDQVKKLVDQVGREKILGIVFNAFEMNIFDKRMRGEGYYNYLSEGY